MNEIEKREQETAKGKTIRKFNATKKYKENFDKIFNKRNEEDSEEEKKPAPPK